MAIKRILTAILLPVSLTLAFHVHADVCVWRDPERTMIRLFPEAKDYRTEVYKLQPPQITRIEQLAGEPLEATEKQEYNIYAITADGRTLGWVLALAGMGEYGVIETVIGLDPDHRIRGVYLQRVRERQRKALQSDAFLGQFVGQRQGDPLDLRPAAGAEAASQEIARVIRKMLAYDAVLNHDATSPSTSRSGE